jgi:hypothetical protein
VRKSRKETGLSPQKRGCEKVKKKKRKEKNQGRQEGGSSKGKIPCALHQEFPFFGSQVFGLRSGPSRLKYWLLRDLVYKEAMWEGSSRDGLLYAAKAVPKKDYFTHLFSKSSILKGLLYAG